MVANGATIVWLTQDLRLRDNPALHAATAGSSGPVIPLYIWSPQEEGPWPPGAAQRWWLHRSLDDLGRRLEALGSRLVLARGPILDSLLSVAAATGARAVHWSRRYEPAAAAAQNAVATALRAEGIAARVFEGALLVRPEALSSAAGTPYRQYSAFRRALLRDAPIGSPLPAPRTLQPPRSWPDSVTLESLRLLPEISWHEKFAQSWSPGEPTAQRQLRRFLHASLARYEESRNLPAMRATSRLSPHLHFGEIGPRQIWHALARRRSGRSGFLSELLWREFAYHMLHHFPFLTDQPLRQEFARFPWRCDAARLRAWHKGLTGVPLVDAGMRELWATGWMHNRARMVTASFLVKNLMVPWQEGARWFWDTLVDADLASNTLNWQWVAGCGVDAAPFFRIFNPLTQAERFDPTGSYVRKWVPELDSPDYPAPMVNWAASRAAALDAFRALRQRPVPTVAAITSSSSRRVRSRSHRARGR